MFDRTGFALLGDRRRGDEDHAEEGRAQVDEWHQGDRYSVIERELKISSPVNPSSQLLYSSRVGIKS